jgi:tetratricopeptide (TPR) repeat protein
MRSFQHLLLSTFILAAAAVAPPTFAQDHASSLWELNGSVLGLYKNGTERIFRYEEPRQAVRELGVETGTVMFNGTLAGNTYTGTAFVFHHRCGPTPFDVEGTLNDDERRIAFSGEQPMSFDEKCRVVDVEDVEFEIIFLRSLAPPIVVGSIDRDPPAVNDAEEREKARLAAILADKEREERRLRDLLAENDRNERELRERQRQREQEEKRLSDLRHFSEQRDACRRYSIAACDTALRSPHASTQDAIDLQNWRGIALTFRVDLDACKNGSFSACDAALASPALLDAQRNQLQQWRAAASPYNRALMWFSGYIATVTAAANEATTTIRNLPTSTHVTGGLAAILTLALAGMALRSRRAQSADHPATAQPPEPDASPQQASASPAARASLSEKITQVFQRAPQPEAPAKSMSAAAAAPPAVRDTPGAIAALELAYAYIEEVREAETPGLEDHDLRKHHLNTLALASKQLDAAETIDPDAILEGQDEKEIPYRYSINELKSEALLLEGLTHQTYDVKRAIPALRKATTLNPNSARAFYVLGLTHAANMNKGEAVAAFERAVALDPKNLAYRKELNRAQSLSAGTIAAYKATRAGEKIFDAGVKTANAGIFIYNIGVYTWNVFAFTWNVLTFPFRLVLKIFGVFDRMMGFK